MGERQRTPETSQSVSYNDRINSYELYVFYIVYLLNILCGTRSYNL